MIRKLCNWLLYDLLGWKTHVTVEHPKKFIICLAPHTSNWDFLIGLLYMYASGMRINFLMKQEWFFWPLGPIFRRVGGIPVHRAKHTSMTDSLAEIASKQEEFKLCVTPEGTRSLNPDWKKGFYFIALKARVPVLLYGVDYGRKLIECTRSFIPTGDFEREMRQTKLYFKDYRGKKPEKFTIGEIL